MSIQNDKCRGHKCDEWIPCTHVRCDVCGVLLYCTNCGVCNDGYMSDARVGSPLCGACYLAEGANRLNCHTFDTLIRRAQAR